MAMIVNMFVPHNPAFAKAQQRLAHIAEAISSYRHSPIWWCFFWPFYYVYLWVRIWLMVKSAERNVRRTKNKWSWALTRFRYDAKAYPPAQEAEAKRLSRELRDSWDAKLDDTERDLEELDVVFPRYAARMRTAVREMYKYQCEYLINIIPGDDDWAINEADRQYAHGELMDLETFVNGVRGI